MYRLKFWCFALLMVHLKAISVNADKHGGMHPEFKECADEFGITPEKMKEVKKTGSTAGVDPCFFACVFKKTGVIDNNGMYDAEKALDIHHDNRPKNPEILAAIEKSKSECTSVNDKIVSDGDKGCERAALLFKCFQEHKQEMIMKMNAE